MDNIDKEIFNFLNKWSFNYDEETILKNLNFERILDTFFKLFCKLYPNLRYEYDYKKKEFSKKFKTGNLFYIKYRFIEKCFKKINIDIDWNTIYKINLKKFKNLFKNIIDYENNKDNELQNINKIFDKLINKNSELVDINKDIIKKQNEINDKLYLIDMKKTEIQKISHDHEKSAEYFENIKIDKDILLKEFEKVEKEYNKSKENYNKKNINLSELMKEIDKLKNDIINNEEQVLETMDRTEKIYLDSKKEYDSIWYDNSFLNQNEINLNNINKEIINLIENYSIINNLSNSINENEKKLNKFRVNFETINKSYNEVNNLNKKNLESLEFWTNEKNIIENDISEIFNKNSYAIENIKEKYNDLEIQIESNNIKLDEMSQEQLNLEIVFEKVNNISQNFFKLFKEYDNCIRKKSLNYIENLKKNLI